MGICECNTCRAAEIFPEKSSWYRNVVVTGVQKCTGLPVSEV